MKLAPWWAYLVPFLALNYARAVLVDTSGAGDIALALATAALVFATVTALHRARPRNAELITDRTHQRLDAGAHVQNIRGHHCRANARGPKGTGSALREYLLSLADEPPESEGDRDPIALTITA